MTGNMITPTTTEVIEASQNSEGAFEKTSNGTYMWRDEQNTNVNNATLGKKLDKETINGTNRNSQNSLETSSTDFSDFSDDYESNNCVHKFQLSIASGITNHKSFLSTLVAVLCLAGYTVYLVFAIKFDFELAKALIVITAIVVFCIVYCFIRDHFGTAIYEKCMLPIITPIDKHWDIIKW